MSLALVCEVVTLAQTKSIKQYIGLWLMFMMLYEDKSRGKSVSKKSHF